MRNAMELNTECWYRAGDHIELTDALDLGPYGPLPKGALGVVAYVDSLTLYTEILMTDYHHGLRELGNHLWIIPPDTDEIEAAIKLVMRVPCLL